MLLSLAFILLAVWVIGLALKVTFGLIHLALVGAVALAIGHFVTRRQLGPPHTPNRLGV